MTDFSTLSLSAPVLRAIEEQGFTTTTEIQAATIPALMTGQDVIGISQTGGGKTAAFVLPMIERLMAYEDKPKSGMPRALILAPTRELALQISETVKALSRHTELKNCTIFGGAPYRTQIHILRRGVDILVATPGRLLDHMKQGNIYLDETEYFVLDEADRMLDMGFVDDVRLVAAKMMSDHQSVMFSATMNGGIRTLANTLLKNPAQIEVAREATIADNLTHKVMFVPYDKKHDLLLHMIETKKVTKSLIFVRTKREADELAGFMEASGFSADSIHGDKQQRQRERIIRGFKGDRTDFLVATDVAARGIDVKDIGHVFNIDVPVEAESYVHRIGRTARGGKSGEAYTFCSKGEFGLLRAVERVIKMEIETEEDNPFPLKIDRHKVKPRGDRPAHRRGGARPFAKDGKPGFKGGKRPSGKPFTGKRADGGRVEGKRFDDRRAEGRSEGKRFEGKRSEGASSDGKRFDGRRSEGGRNESKQFEGKRPEGKRFEGKKPAGKWTDSKRADGGKPEGRRAGPAKPAGKPAGKKFGPKKAAGKPALKSGFKAGGARKAKTGGNQPLKRRSA
ncbi:DEAD/DEAH box helicase [Kordiimonas sp.]|uniref:DEAD/DEAH box helicase n=1 Tax=Kordiimonas sp. TaxID=1970157 RepID=UPI003A922087